MTSSAAALGSGRSQVAWDTGLTASTLQSLHNNCADLYLAGDADDQQLKAALNEVRPLKDAHRVEPQAVEELVEQTVAEQFANE